MRILALAAVCGFSIAMAGAASAQQRLRIEVKPRSFLDAGKVVPVGSMQNYMYDGGAASDHARFGSRGGTSILPDRFSAGRGFTFETPIIRGFD